MNKEQYIKKIIDYQNEVIAEVGNDGMHHGKNFNNYLYQRYLTLTEKQLKELSSCANRTYEENVHRSNSSFNDTLINFGVYKVRYNKEKKYNGIYD